MSNTKVSFAETLIIKVGRFLREEYPNIAFASCTGISCQQLTTESALGLLDANSALQLNWWQKIFCLPRRRFMGVLWFSNEARSATHGKWVLEVYGDQDIDFLKGVSVRLAEKFNTSVHLKLISENAHYETFYSDDDM
ncbi:hypothetical protein IPH92_01355 [Candidatus Kaiserbacteria bacterium]|nr:MAG: hypothetical protein IPH92_01355 [Candidatus Kaiserbacteria bacterium]